MDREIGLTKENREQAESSKNWAAPGGKTTQGQRVTQAGTALPGSGAAPEPPNKAVLGTGELQPLLCQRRKVTPIKVF